MDSRKVNYGGHAHGHQPPASNSALSEAAEASSTCKHPSQHYSSKIPTPPSKQGVDPQNLWFSQKGNPTLTNSPRETGKEHMYVIATLRISYKKSKDMSNTARKTLHLHSLLFQEKCQEQGKHRDLITSRDVRKELKCIQNAEAAFFFKFQIYFHTV